MSTGKGYFDREKAKRRRQVAYLDRKYDKKNRHHQSYFDDLALIHELQKAGEIDPSDAEDFRKQAEEKYDEVRREQADERYVEQVDRFITRRVFPALLLILLAIPLFVFYWLKSKFG